MNSIEVTCWGFIRQQIGIHLKQTKQWGEVSGFRAIHDPWSLWWLILIVSLISQTKLRGIPVGKSVRVFPGSADWREKIILQCCVPGGDSDTSKEVQGKSIVDWLSALTHCWAQLLLLLPLLSPQLSSLADIRLQLLWPSNMDWRQVTWHESSMPSELGGDC